ncbi:glutamine--tRNA ligase/YqeY domain fusion protein [Litorivicinus sp.]|nr:glutamine--tRNA ligase/YqeY domain fusion protein [Litorivicinus sp.]
MSEKPTNFIRTKIADQIKQGQLTEVITRFPPEPNGYLHVGHAKSICLNFGLAEEFGGRCHLRFDDTNPEKESQEYIDAIEADVRWLGFDWSALCHTADYFQQLFDWALHLIRNGDAYVDEQSAEAMRANRGTLTEPGIDSPYRKRSPEENEALFVKMRDGELPEGAAVLRAKISMSAPNLNLRDPALYRIRHLSHPRTGDQWCIYPTYDYAHGQSDAIEGITHSLCTLEFEDHRPLYEWLLKKLPVSHRPKQTEFSRLELEGTVTSKRKLNALVESGNVSGWDDPRMPTIAGMRRRGYSPEGIRLFCERIGVTRKPNTIELQILEGSIRDDLERRAHKAMAVLNPLKVVVTNWDQVHLELDVPWHPKRPELGSRTMLFSRELSIERSDFELNPPDGFFRLSPGSSVRLKYGFIVDFEDVVLDAQGQVSEVYVRYDPETRSGQDQSGRKVKGTIHWVHAASAREVDVRLYDRLFTVPDPGNYEDLASVMNSESLINGQALVEPALGTLMPDVYFQFERVGFFRQDSESSEDRIIYNRSVTLKDAWAKKK